MKQIAAEATAGRLLPKFPTRRVALIGGTTTFQDCVVALRYLLDPRQLVQGPDIAEYESAFARRIGARYAYSFCHGRVGLYGLLRGLDIGPGDEVLLQVPTHIVVANAVRFTGAKPVYVDCCLDTYNMDLEQAEQRITPRTKALVLQHTFGIPVDLDAALDLTRRKGLNLIEDCVHGLGATYAGRPIGSLVAQPSSAAKRQRRFQPPWAGWSRPMIQSWQHESATSSRVVLLRQCDSRPATS